MRALIIVGLLVTTVGLAALGGAWLARRSSAPQAVPEERPARVPYEPQDWAAQRVPVGVPEPEPEPVAPSITVAARWSDTNRDAIAALEAGELERAVELFEACVVAVPDEPVFARNAAEALARLAVRGHAQRNPCAECLAWMERA